MIAIFRHSFIFRQTVFTIPFRIIISLFDLIFHEFDKFLGIKFKDETISVKTNKQINYNIYNSTLDNSCSYDLDDIIGTNYRKRNPKQKFSSKPPNSYSVELDYGLSLFKKQCPNSTRRMDSLEHQSESQQIFANVSNSCLNTDANNPNIIEQNCSTVSSFMSNIVKELNISTDSSQENDAQTASIDSEQNYNPVITSNLSSVSEIKGDEKCDDTLTNTFDENEESRTATPDTDDNELRQSSLSTTAPATPVAKEECDEQIFTKDLIVINDAITPSSENCVAKVSFKEIAITMLSSKDTHLKRAAPLVPPSFNASIPIDIFIEVCYHLSPASLFSLMCVCKQFRFWLNSSASYVTQDIWRTSRMKYLERIKLRPPIGMEESTYIKLTMLERGCQFCGTRKETPKVYWAFRVRSCRECLRKRIISSENLPKWAKLPIDITMLVPYERINAFDSNLNGKITVYWSTHLEQGRRECMSNPLKQRSAWIQKKKLWVAELLNEVEKRERIDELCFKKQSLDDERIFRTLLDEFRQIKDEKGQQKYLDKYIFQLPAYLEAQDTWKIPFMTRPWPTFIDRLKMEYPTVLNKMHRLQQMTEMMLSLITSYDTLASDIKTSPDQGYQIYLTDPVIDCIQWCPSFINPPYVNNDENIPWTEEYLIKVLIPKLRREARHLLKNPEIKRPGPFTSVRGCMYLIEKEVEDKDFFKCRLCWKSTRKLYNYDGICRHLTSGRHSIARIDDERMIEADREKVKKLLPVWFARFH
ncbi:17253_t:CDS:2 [Funneliformis geosporum]|uniref:7549_t:CDS:1 n=1 Tax=Funneliformis geosporum TaxID=1117311 RepID=A0A9W4WKX0_9GLOM|nr:7549_t:CDS:2 [Funneliformis geosporum]CAI2161641.1 17253_t:CDS:2 [Funneliformis geosporum]